MMNIEYALMKSDYKHVKNKEIQSSMWNNSHIDITVAREEKFAFSIILKADEEFTCSLDSNNNISYKGLISRIRFNLDLEDEIKDNFNISFVGYVNDDNGDLVGDVILRESYDLVGKGENKVLWVEGRIPRGFKKDKLDLNIKLYLGYAYEEEREVENIKAQINVLDITLDPINQGDFYLDLWQHPSNWSRMYNVPLWCDDHFKIIENYIEELASLGQKTITAIVSDFLWGGQGCYKVFKNPSNLFEMNMIKVKRNTKGDLTLDFSVIDRYIEICMKHGIDKEIDLFGISGNWDVMGFGNPLEDYKDPIRVNYYDENIKSFKYITAKEDIGIYIKHLFNHLIEKGWWNKVRVMSDEPTDISIVSEFMSFIDELSLNHKVIYKSAIHYDECFKHNEENFGEISLSLPLVIKNYKGIDKLKEKINKDGGKLTYYVCCFPDKINNFLSSPLIENRLVPWLAYYYNLDGFLRWDYAIWPKDPLKDASYKHPNWRAGDMFFVYPGRDMKPLRSLRWENMRFGIQDYALFKMLESKGISKDTIKKKLIEKYIGKKEDLKYIDVKNVFIPDLNKDFKRCIHEL